MGREIKRVPLDFAWPLNEVWDGYLLPDHLHEPRCEVCEGDGLTPEARAIDNTFYPHQIGCSLTSAERLAWYDKIGQAEVDNLLAVGRLRTLVRRDLTTDADLLGDDDTRGWEWLPLPRTAAEVNAEQRVRYLGGHDALNRMILVEFRCRVLGIPTECASCEGNGSGERFPGQRAAAEAWERLDPPTGEGWQLWETVSEGSPVSPVFATSEDLAQWLTTRDGGAAAGPSHRPLTIEQARGFVSRGWAPTFVADAGGLHDGAEFIGTEAALPGLNSDRS
jgi:hypothetical protein